MTISQTFERLRSQDEIALIPYMTAGFPTLRKSIDHLETVARSGGDIIEVGIPFSDPVADGPTIQYASQVALENGVTLAKTLDALSHVDLGKPLVAMSYLNPLTAYGMERLFDDLRAARVTGLIIPDLPAEEADDWQASAEGAGIDLVFLIAPTSTSQRIKHIAERSQGFLYYVSITGITGARSALAKSLPDRLAEIRKVTDTPIAVGFGISTPEQVRSLRSYADAAVVGSRIIDAVRREENLFDLIKDLKAATRNTHTARHED